MASSQVNMLYLIDKKRRGEAHTEGEIQMLITEMMADHIPDYQLSAWLMAVCLKGLNIDETTWLTEACVNSGFRLDLSSVDGVVVDKHSTGGVGDKTTLVLIPLLAVSGVKVAKLSGRGLGFTGGTIDKLEAIPGFQVSLSNEKFIQQIQKIGVAISSQTSKLAPADGKLYALRDVTGTVSSIPLIAASVVSKKIASGAKVIVLDIKYGRGAFMANLEDAKALAHTCREVGTRLGRSIKTVISSMEQPLGLAIGHTLEVIETIETLKGKGPADLRELCLKLGGLALVAAGVCSDLPQAEVQLAGHLDDGSALAKFKELIIAQGGDADILEDYSLMPHASRTTVLPATRSGYISGIDSLGVAQAAKMLGAGRTTKADVLDLGVGVVLHKKVGEHLEEGETLLELYSCGGKNHHEALEMAANAFSFSETPVSEPTLIEEIWLEETALV